MKRIFLVWLAAALFAASLSACGSPSNVSGVPDRVAELVVLDYFDEHEMEKGDYNSYSFEVTHDYDRGSNSDAAVINLRIEYNYASECMSIPAWYTYDRASGLWSLTRQGSWSEPVANYYGEMLAGIWYFSYDINYARINIQSVEQNEAKVEYTVESRARKNDFSSRDKEMYVKGEGTFQIENNTLLIYFDLPEGFYNSGYGFTKSYTDSLNISVDCQLGCDSIPNFYSLRYE